MRDRILWGLTALILIIVSSWMVVYLPPTASREATLGGVWLTGCLGLLAFLRALSPKKD